MQMLEAIESMENLQINNEEEDRLSSLPETLLEKILEFVPFKSAAATSVLSQRWRHLWTHHPHPALTLSDENIHEQIISVNRIFDRLDCLPIQTFEIYYPSNLTDYYSNRFPVALDYWVSRLYKHKSITKIKLDIRPKNDRRGIPPDINLSSRIFQSQTLEHLELFGSFACFFPEYARINLPNLKKMVLFGVYLDDNLLRNLFKSCPLLEDLFLSSLSSLTRMDPIFNISSSNLKSLSIGHEYSAEFVIDAPILEFIEVRGRVASYRFVKELGKLRETTLGITLPITRIDELKDASNFTRIPTFFTGISNVESIHFDKPNLPWMFP
ncbi:FBD-associated F-box protein At4g10400-like [Spinacia oleracea]|uniref:FBD-associated F-box protein At4g10400-like n=1 Tax=Spinacia oleracea TaxID=3562 RepID=A0ABM3R113_SPIOL|nr:FBD-associated F-box protein At4g10400-like [Spinacia oleracea]